MHVNAGALFALALVVFSLPSAVQTEPVIIAAAQGEPRR